MCATKSLFSSGGITQPFTFHGLISFFLTPCAPFHATPLPHRRVQPFYLPTSLRTSVRNPEALCCNSMQPSALQNHHLLLFPLPAGTPCALCMLQNLLLQSPA